MKVFPLAKGKDHTQEDACGVSIVWENASEDVRIHGMGFVRFAILTIFPFSRLLGSAHARRNAQRSSSFLIPWLLEDG